MVANSRLNQLFVRVIITFASVTVHVVVVAIPTMRTRAIDSARANVEYI